eukprot:712241-Prymnesium_polylepis.1
MTAFLKKGSTYWDFESPNSPGSSSRELAGCRGRARVAGGPAPGAQASPRSPITLTGSHVAHATIIPEAFFNQSRPCVSEPALRTIDHAVSCCERPRIIRTPHARRGEGNPGDHGNGEA